MMTFFLHVVVCSLLSMKGVVCTARCLENESFSGGDSCHDAPNILMCIRQCRLVDDGNMVVSFTSANRTCCYSNSTTAVQLIHSKGSSVCFKVPLPVTLLTATPSNPTHTAPESPTVSTSTPTTTTIQSATVIATTPTTTTTQSTTTEVVTTTTAATTPTTPTPPTTTSTTTEAGTCALSWTRIGGACFKHYSISVSWSIAQFSCHMYGANLAHVYALDDFINLMGLLTCTAGEWGCEPWLGINDEAVEGQLVGIAGQAVSNAVSTTVTGNNHFKDCTYFNGGDSVLYIRECNEVDSFICEKNLN